MTIGQSRCTALVFLALVTAVTASAQDRPKHERHQALGTGERAKVEADDDTKGQRGKHKVGRSRRSESADVLVFTLKYSDAEGVARVLAPLWPTLSDVFAITADERTNTLLVTTANEQTTNNLHRLLEALDRPTETTETEGDRCEGIQLQNAVAAEVVEHLYSLTPRRPGRSALRFVADERANTVWLAGSDKLVEHARQLVQRMDQSTAVAKMSEPADKRVLRFYELEQADALRLADTMNKLARQIDLDLHVVADPLSGILVTHATTDEDAILKQIVQKLDVTPKHAFKQPAERKRSKARADGRRRHGGTDEVVDEP